MSQDNPYEIPTGRGVGMPSPHMVYLLIDCSTSMEGSPLRQAKDGALAFADDARTRGYRVGLIRFADKANALLNPEHGFDDAVENLVAYGNTNLTDAIALATTHLVQESSGSRVMCVVTDGMPDNSKTALRAAAQAAKLGIGIMVIGTAAADQKFLSKLATSSGLASYVNRDQLRQGVTDMAKLLPPPRS
jgi:Mg-chelatase subunit ChlD